MSDTDPGEAAQPIPFDQAPIGVVQTAADGAVTRVNERALTVLELNRETTVGTDIREAFPASTEDSLEGSLDRPAPHSERFEEYYPGIDRWLDVTVVVPAADPPGATVYVQDITDERENDQRLDDLKRRLDRMEGIERLVATVLRDLIDAEGRDEIAQTVCDRLGATDLYEFAWVGERDRAADRLRIVATGGEAPAILESIEEHLDGGGTLPEQRVVATGNPEVIERIANDDSVPHPVRLAAFSNGLQSAVAVPLVHRGTVYGVLGVYSHRERGVSEQERTSLETLGAIGGFAINALRQESLLFADTVIEVGLQVADPSIPFVKTADETGAELTLEGVVPREDGAVMCYVTADPSDVTAATFEERVGVSAARAIEGASDRFEVELSGTAPVRLLAGWGATVQRAEYTGRRAEIVAELPPEAELTQLVDTVASEFDGVELTKKERQRRDSGTIDAFRDELEASLTDRQRKVLRTAYLADYFASPKGSTSEEIAESLDITGPTVLYHLRRAQSKLLAAFFTAEDAGIDGSRRG